MRYFCFAFLLFFQLFNFRIFANCFYDSNLSPFSVVFVESMKILWSVGQDLPCDVFFFKIRFSFWSRFPFYIGYKFNSCFTSLTISTEWILCSFTPWIKQCSKYSMSKEQNQKKRDKKTDKARSLSHCELGYQSLLERLLADYVNKLDSVRFKSRIKYSVRI